MKSGILRYRHLALTGATAFVAFLSSEQAFAHCDTMDGPLIREAKAALQTGDVTPLLKWVEDDDEETIRAAFDSARDVRTASEEARELADRYFFETLVRIHRAGEGAPFTGLKPAGAVDPAAAEADAAIAEGSADELAHTLAESIAQSVKSRFDALKLAEEQKDASVEKGREYVAAYVNYVHFVEAVHGLTSEQQSVHAETDHSVTREH